MTSELYLAGGCFWGLEEVFRGLRGVVSTECGYVNGDPHLIPDYMLVCSGRYGYREAVHVVFDEDTMPLEKVLEIFFRVIHPEQQDGQGNDIGTQYRTGVYWTDPEVARRVGMYIDSEAPRHRMFYTDSGPLVNYTPAESHHQKYLQANPTGYCHIPRGEMESIKREWNGI